MKTLLHWISVTKKSVLAFGVSLALGLLSMGLLGIGLYYSVAPALRLRFPPLDQWHGDWVWPAMIAVGMAWSAGFLIAGGVNHLLASWQLPPTLRRLVYVCILWVWALALWAVTLASSANEHPF